MCSQTFYPNMQIFLHGYNRHFRDISQLWICTSYLKSVNFLVCCWCWGAIDTDGDQLSLTKNGLSRQQAWSTHPLCCQGNNPNPSLKNQKGLRRQQIWSTSRQQEEPTHPLCCQGNNPDVSGLQKMMMIAIVMFAIVLYICNIFLYSGFDPSP